MGLCSDEMSLVDPGVGMCLSGQASEVSMEVMIDSKFFCICAKSVPDFIDVQGGQDTVLE